jgi:hypothetical protein
VSIVSATEPGQPGGAPGSIEAVVNVKPDPNASGGNGSGGNGGGPGSGGGPGDGGGGGTGGGSGQGGSPSTPEPSSLLLAGLGLPVFLARRLKARSKLAA